MLNGSSSYDAANDYGTSAASVAHTSYDDTPTWKFGVSPLPRED